MCRMRIQRSVALTVFAAIGVWGCGSGDVTIGRACTFTTDCAAGSTCVAGICRAGDGGMGNLDGTSAPLDQRTSGDQGSVTPGCSTQCAANQICARGACVRGFGPCTTTNDCPGDSHCDTELHQCIPWGVPETETNDPSCAHLSASGAFAPTVQCEFTTPPPGDPFPDHVHVLSTPLVVDFAITRGPDDPARPSIIAIFDDGEDGGAEHPTGVIRILDGATCQQQAQLGSLQMVGHSTTPAIADLNGDGRPDIVAHKAGGGLVAFSYDTGTRAWKVLWTSTYSDGRPYNLLGGVPTTSCVGVADVNRCKWYGPSIADLDDDGVPEILKGAVVFDNAGRMVNEALGMLDYHFGVFPVPLDVDADGKVELVLGDGVYEWETAGKRWVRETYFMGDPRSEAGQVAVADFGNFPGRNNWPAETPEVVVISGGKARVQTIDGTIVFGLVDLASPGGPAGAGGPPTIADFDGDGRPEFASAGSRAYTVFDLDCGPNPIGTCASGTTNGILWSQRSQDESSAATGSSVFDFEGDGRAEAIYGDECFTRVYDGRTGTVVFSQARSSCTWYENPIVADVDGDFNAEIVVGDNFNCGSGTSGISCDRSGLGPRNTDPIFPGLRCGSSADCLSGSCVESLCRCETDDQCCSGAGCARARFVCETAPTGTPGAGKTCRASRPQGVYGLRVYSDREDRWVNSRMVWNQHAYHVTNISEAGIVPRTRDVRPNWRDPMLNNFRQNVQGTGRANAAADITSGGQPLVCDARGARLQARVCNRGATPVGTGVSVGFYVGDPATGGTRICAGAAVGNLLPSACELVECEWPQAPMTLPGVDVWVVADDGREARECRETNNVTIFRNVVCGAIF